MNTTDVKYTVDEHGIIHMERDDELPIIDYRPYYEKLGLANTAMSLLRLGLIEKEITRGYKEGRSICDIGPGNGEFIRCCSRAGYRVSYYDNLPENRLPYFRCPDIEDVMDLHGIVTMFDSLEHIKDLSFLRKASNDHFLITLPRCPSPYPNSSEFLNWHHRKPNEHWHHFTPLALESLFDSLGYILIYQSSVEDVIRSRPAPNSLPNTFTSIFKRS